MGCLRFLGSLAKRGCLIGVGSLFLAGFLFGYGSLACREKRGSLEYTGCGSLIFLG